MICGSGGHEWCTSLKQLAEHLIRLTGTNQPIVYKARNQATLVRNRIGSPKRAAEELGFSARIDLEQGLRRLIAWRAAHKRAAAPAEKIAAGAEA